MATVFAENSVVTPFAAVKEQRLDLQLRQLEFHALLHRKLDLELLFESFMSEAQSFLKFDGISYQSAQRGKNLFLGEMRQHREQFGLRLGERELGKVVFMRSKAFSPREQREAQRLAESLIYPLDNALEHYMALLQDMTDGVSGVHNQLALEKQLPREIRLARRAEQPMSVMMMSVDNLDTISEVHGSKIEQQAWQSVANTLSSHLRQSDMIFRTELDEFLIVLNHTDEQGALALADRLRRGVGRAVSFDNVQFVLTASAGISELCNEDSAMDLVDRARDALGQAMKAGRNQVCSLHAEDVVGDDDNPDGGSAA